MSTIRQHNTKPFIRFSSYSEDWQFKKLGEVAKKSSDRNSTSLADMVLTNSAVKGIMPQSDFFNKDIAIQGNLDNYYKVRLDDFIYNPRISSSAPVGPFKRNHYGNGVMSPLYTVYTFKKSENIDFFENYFTSTHWYRYMKSVANYGARHDRMAISSSDLDNLPVPYPDPDEQSKISDFFLQLSDRINLLNLKLQALHEYKNGLVQALFSQKIRFKDKDGNDYPDWKAIRLKEILKERKTYLTKGGDLEHISLTVKGVVPKTDRYERDFLVKKGSDKSYKITKLDDICYNPANLKFGVIARNKYGDGIFSPIYITFEVHDHNAAFVEYLVTRKEFIKKARKYEEGTVYERMAVKPSDLTRLMVYMPQIEEQEKIANFIALIEEKISLQEFRLKQANKFKKALLQQMFV